MNETERDELDGLSRLVAIDHDPWTGRDVDVLMVRHSDARRIIDDLRRQLAEVTKERDGYYTKAKHPDVRVAELTNDLTQAREQLATANADAAAMRVEIHRIVAIMYKWHAMVTLDDYAKLFGRVFGEVVQDAQTLLASVTAGRDMLDEMRRKDERIKELESRWKRSFKEEARQRSKCHAAKAALVKARERIAELEQLAEMTFNLTVKFSRPSCDSGYELSNRVTSACRKLLDKPGFLQGLSDSSVMEAIKEPKPEPVYWRFKSRLSASYKADGGKTYVFGDYSNEWSEYGYPVSVLDSSAFLERCNADGSPLVKPVEWQYRRHDNGLIWRTSDGIKVQMRDDNGWFPCSGFPAWQACCDEPGTYQCNEHGERIEDHIADTGKMVDEPLEVGDWVELKDDAKTGLAQGEILRRYVDWPAKISDGLCDDLADAWLVVNEAGRLDGYQSVFADPEWLRRVPAPVNDEAGTTGPNGLPILDVDQIIADKLLDDDPEPAKCKSCGIAYTDHLGIQGTCRELQELRQQLAAQAELVKLAEELREWLQGVDPLEAAADVRIVVTHEEDGDKLLGILKKIRDAKGSA